MKNANGWTYSGTYMEPVCKVLREDPVVDFVRAVVRAGYLEFFAADASRVEVLVEEAFGDLAASQANGINPPKLAEATSRLIRGTFRKDDPMFWFNRGYHEYKTRAKPETDFAQLQKLIRGQRVLDYGCGSGYVAARLARGGFTVFTTDVLDYRYAEARHLPFLQMSSAADLAFPDDGADTALVQAVLHHIDMKHLPLVLTQLGRVARYIVIKEDTYDLTPDLEGYRHAFASQELLRSFVTMSRDMQYQVLILIDFYANAIAQGVPQMNMPFSFKSVAEWRRVFGENGFSLQDVRVVGFERGRVHKSCHVWMVFERGAQV